MWEGISHVWSKGEGPDGFHKSVRAETCCSSVYDEEQRAKFLGEIESGRICV